MTAPSPAHDRAAVGIVGAGFAGIIAALALRDAGRFDLRILERAGEVGGVWRENVYPGCACDVPSNLYSVASRPNPDWRSTFASQPEILGYLRRLSRDELADHLRLGWDVAEARFRPRDGGWRLTSTTGATLDVRSLILALGPHSRPVVPSLPGLDTFQGATCHTARWPDDLDLRSRRVAVIGTGASAVQLVPHLAEVAREVVVIQRSAPYVLPRRERRRTALERALYRRVPAAQAVSRGVVYALMEAIGLGFVGPRVANRALAGVALRHLRRQVADPALRRALTPDYRAGCKRIMLSDTYYPALTRSTVHLVPHAATGVTETGVRTADGAVHPADVIVFATGYRVADPAGILRVVGLDGRVLADEWSRGRAQAYLGTTISGYPNLAFLLGPNAGISHSSALHVVESQMAYVLRYIDALDAAPGALDVRPEAQGAYNRWLRQRLDGMVWGSGCRSWYLDAQGRNTTIFPGLTLQFRRRLRTLYPSAYRRLSGAPAVLDEPSVDEAPVPVAAGS